MNTANRSIVLAVVAVGLIAALYALQHTVSCFLLSFVLAYLLDPFVVFLEKRKLRRIYGILILYALLMVAALLFFGYLVPFLTIHWHELVQNLPVYVQKAKLLMVSLKTRFTPAYGAEEWSWLFDALSAGLDKGVAKIGTGVYAAATRVVFNLFNLLLAPILIFFMLIYKQQILEGTASWLPEKNRAAILELGREINASIGGYIRGQLMVSIIVAVLSIAALFFLDVDYPIINGLFAGLASIIPFVGVIIATIPPLFFAYLKFQSGMAILKVAAAFAVIYFIEGYLIKPLVFKEAMDLNPLVTIIVVMAFGELMGFWGILLAIPIAAAAKIFTYHLRRGDFAGEA